LRSCPDIIVRTGTRTLVYEVKPASPYGRSGRAAAQIQRYTRSLQPPAFPNAQPGPAIAPAVGPVRGGGWVQIFSAANWQTFAPTGLPAARNGSGIIYYKKIPQPRRRTPAQPAPDPVRKPATNPAVQPAPMGEPDVGLIPNLGDQMPDEGLIPNLGDFLNHPAPAPAQNNAPAVGCGVPVVAALRAACPPGQVPGGGYVPFPPGIWGPVPVPELPGIPVPVPAIP
jgi:hypothetical protein